MSRIFDNITTTVSHTPLVRINRVSEGSGATVLVKVESFNPHSSVKDRIGTVMIEDAERSGILKKDSVLIEPTSGNTGIALAFVAAGFVPVVLNQKVIVVVLFDTGERYLSTWLFQ